MEKALGSHIYLNEYDSFVSIEFNEFISDLIDSPELIRLKEYSQHCDTSRYQHSLNVAYYSYLLAKLLHCDSRSAARGGLLHDLFHYNWREMKLSKSHHAALHPHIALFNAKKICNLNKIEEDIIIKHMWPLTIKFPKYKESYIITFVDKYCAAYEAIFNSCSKLFVKMKFQNIKNRLFL